MQRGDVGRLVEQEADGRVPAIPAALCVAGVGLFNGGDVELGNSATMIGRRSSGCYDEPYQAIGLVPTMWGIRRREEIAKNLEHLEHLAKAAFWLCGLDLPVRLVAIPEGAAQGLTDETRTSSAMLVRRARGDGFRRRWRVLSDRTHIAGQR